MVVNEPAMPPVHLGERRCDGAHPGNYLPVTLDDIAQFS